MVSTALLGAGPRSPADHFAPSLYGLAVQNLRVRLRAHTSPRPSSVGISASPAKRCTDFVHATTVSSTITQTSRILKRLHAASGPQPLLAKKARAPARSGAGRPQQPQRLSGKAVANPPSQALRRSIS